MVISELSFKTTKVSRELNYFEHYATRETGVIKVDHPGTHSKDIGILLSSFGKVMKH